jgi:hypothetical protein
MGQAEKDTAKRIGRSIVAVVIEEIIKYVTASPYSIIAIPIIQGVGKFLRAKFKWTWLPF